MPRTDSELMELASTRTDLFEFEVGEFAVCNSCSKPSIIYNSVSDSHFEVNGIYYTEMCAQPACAYCLYDDMKRYLMNIYSSGDDYADLRLRLEISQFKLMTTARADMQMLPLCAVCLCPEVGTTAWSFEQLPVRNQDESDNHVLLNVHVNCTAHSEVNECEGSCGTYVVRNHSLNGRDMFFNTRSYQLFQYPFYTQVSNDYFCEPCFVEARNYHDIYLCVSCEEYTYDCNRFDNEHYCDHCYNENIYHCGGCNEMYHCNDGHDCGEDDDYEDNSLIHSYGYKPSTEFFGEGKWHLGFELEVENYNSSKHDGAQIAQDLLGARAYMKEDGSLNDGFEIVTHPHTLEAYNKDFNWSFLSKLQVSGFRSWNTGTCGLHVHVSRTAFAVYGIRTRAEQILMRQAHELRFMKLIYDNQRQVERIAGRVSNHYSTFGDKGSLVPKVKHGYQNDGRYSAVNTENYATLEVRVFRGSLKETRVRSALEFVHAAVEYTRDLKVNGKNNALTWAKFVTFVVTNEDTYPNLMTIINQTFGNERVQD